MNRHDRSAVYERRKNGAVREERDPSRFSAQGMANCSPI